MIRTSTHRVAAIALLLAAWCLPALAGGQAFDLNVELAASSDLAARLEDGDRLRFTLVPQTQYGVDGQAQPIVVERTWHTGDQIDPCVFVDAVNPDRIYRLEMTIVRNDGKRSRTAAYVAALDRLPRRPAESPVPLRLGRRHQSDHRDTMVMVTRDSDGIYRVSVFTA